MRGRSPRCMHAVCLLINNSLSSQDHTSVQINLCCPWVSWLADCSEAIKSDRMLAPYSRQHRMLFGFVIIFGNKWRFERSQSSVSSLLLPVFNYVLNHPSKQADTVSHNSTDTIIWPRSVAALTAECNLWRWVAFVIAFDNVQCVRVSLCVYTYVWAIRQVVDLLAF